MGKQNIVVIFGGQSSEHEVSCISVQTVAKAINRDKYDITYIGITKEGHWLLADSLADIENGSWRDSKTTAVISPDAITKEVILFGENEVTVRTIDVIFPVLHGMYGEDGTIQGLFEMAQIPYVGCGVLSSAVSMDKVYTKIIVDDLGICQADYVAVRAADVVRASKEAGRLSKDGGADTFMAASPILQEKIQQIENTLRYPVFVKPSKAGSSQGVSKACGREELICALQLAAKHDTKILVERCIVGREIECAVMGCPEEVKAAGVGEILSAAEFYDFDAKYNFDGRYNDAESKTVISPELPEGKAEEICSAAKKIFAAVDGYGLARVDFFLEKDTNRVIFNEINTLPGFTSISMYPMLWNAAGVNIEELVEQLIQLAFQRCY